MARDDRTDGPWRLILRPLPDPPGGPRRPDWAGVPPAKRLARLLKFALRVCGLRCVDCREAEEEDGRER